MLVGSDFFQGTFCRYNRHQPIDRKIGQASVAFKKQSMIPQPNLDTSRLILRPFTDSDVDRVAELANDELLSRNLRSFTYPYSVEDARSWVTGLPGEWETGKSAVFAICLRSQESRLLLRESSAVTDQATSAERKATIEPSPDKLLVGAIGIVFEQPSNRAEVGFWLGRQYWGQGITTEACVSVLDFAFAQLGLNKVYAECLTRNPASAAVLQKVGMVQEGVLKKHFRKHEAEDYNDVLLFGLLRSVWNDRA